MRTEYVFVAVCGFGVLNVSQSALRVMVLRFYICQTQIDVLSFYINDVRIAHATQPYFVCREPGSQRIPSVAKTQSSVMSNYN